MGTIHPGNWMGALWRNARVSRDWIWGCIWLSGDGLGSEVGRDRDSVVTDKSWCSGLMATELVDEMPNITSNFIMVCTLSLLLDFILFLPVPGL